LSRHGVSEISAGTSEKGEPKMEVFAILVLFGLGLAVLTTVGYRFVERAREYWGFVAVGLGVGLAWLADLNMWRAWGIDVREPWIGVTLTGLVLAGVAYFWREILGFFAGLERKYNDEAEAIEKTQGLRRVA
jgi:hypothetical protein